METLKSAIAHWGFGCDDKELTPEERKKQDYELTKLKIDSFNATTGNLNEEDEYNCDKCKNKGGIMVIAEHNGFYNEAYQPCECMRVRSMIKKLQKSGLRDSVAKCTFDRYETQDKWQESLRNKAIEFLSDNEHEWFFIGGQSGCGKTHLCTAITVAYLRKNIAARYMMWRDEITKIKALVTDNEQYDAMIKELKTVPVLYIDDLFKMGADENKKPKPPTTADINVAYEIVNYRYNNKGLTTIISSEYMINDIVNIDEALGGRINEKAREGGYCLNVSKDMNKNYRIKGMTVL